MKIESMKKLLKSGVMVLLTLAVLTACDKEEQPEVTSVEGTYYGFIHKSARNQGERIKTTDAEEAVAAVSITGKNELQVHCYSNNFDSTFILNYYDHFDSAYVCFPGELFEEMYGHALSLDHSDGMMNAMHSGESEWMHHWNEEHIAGEMHFGGFDKNHHTFNYTFNITGVESPYTLTFNGTKYQK